MVKRKTMILLGLLLTLFVTSQVTITQAHTPGPMTLDYNMDTDTLTVTVTHVTADVNTHYIYEIVVLKNSVQVDIATYTSQSDSSQVIEIFTIAAEEGDVLSVTAKCSVSGQKTEELTVSASETTTTDTTSSTTTTSTGTMDYTIIMLLTSTAIVVIGVVLVIVLVLKRR